MTTLRGVVHAAGHVDDGAIRRQTSARFARVFEAKVNGALNLDALTRGADLDFFLLYSAGAAVLGSPGQAGYAAANACLDALAADRRAAGLPAASLNWGPWSGGGMAARVSERDRDRWTAQGIRMIDPAFGAAALDLVVGTETAQAVVLPLDWRAIADIPPILRTAAPVRRDEAAPAQSSSHGMAADLAAALAAADDDERSGLLRSCVREQVARVLGLDALARRDDDRGLTELGLDSLMAVELSNRLGAAVGRKLPATIAFDRPTVVALAEYLEGLLDVQLQAAAPAPVTPEPEPETDEFEGLSDEALERSLAEELDRAGY
jgi:acyl carrier protein